MPPTNSVPVQEPEKPSDSGKATYGQILKSTSLIGGASLINLAVGVVRAKAMALILGPSGVGLNGLYTSITNLTESIAGMGINSSGVRQIAEAVGSGDGLRIAKTAAVLRKTSLVLGSAGALCVAIFSRQISNATFGNDSQRAAICFLSLSVLFRLVSAGQGALLQGLRRISDLSKAGVASTVLGMIVTVPLVYVLRERGVVLSLVAAAGIGLATSWWYSHRADVDRVHVTMREVRAEASELLELGSTLMVSGLAMMGGAYVIRLLIQQSLGLHATGLYQAAWTLGCLYVGFILQSMGSDFYPRLTTSIHNSAECNRLVNEQTQINLLLAGSGIIGTLTFSSVVISLFYAPSFAPAQSILRWICLGTALQVISWPLGFVLIAKGKKGGVLFAEISWTLMHILLAWTGLKYFGVIGAGVAFFGSYIFHSMVVYAMAHRLTGFTYSIDNKKGILIYLLLVGVVHCALYILPAVSGIVFGAVAMLGYGYYSISRILALVPMRQMPTMVTKMLALWPRSVGNA